MSQPQHAGGIASGAGGPPGGEGTGQSEKTEDVPTADPAMRTECDEALVSARGPYGLCSWHLAGTEETGVGRGYRVGLNQPSPGPCRDSQHPHTHSGTWGGRPVTPWRGRVWSLSGTQTDLRSPQQGSSGQTRVLRKPGRQGVSTSPGDAPMPHRNLASETTAQRRPPFCRGHCQ